MFVGLLKFLVRNIEYANIITGKIMNIIYVKFSSICDYKEYYCNNVGKHLTFIRYLVIANDIDLGT